MKNAFFESYKSHILSIEGRVDAIAIDQLKTETLKVFSLALEELDSSISKMIHLYDSNAKAKAAFIENCFFEDNPWSIYEQQFKELDTQVVAINKSHDSILIAKEQLALVKDVYTKQLARQQTELIALEQEALAIAKQAEEGVSISKITQAIDSLESHNSEISSDFETELGAQTPYLAEKVTTYLHSAEGILGMKEILLQKIARPGLKPRLILSC